MALIRAKSPNAFDAGRLALSKVRVEDPLLRVVRGLERSIAVNNRDFVWVFNNRVNVAIPSGAGRPLDREERIALLHIINVAEAV